MEKDLSERLFKFAVDVLKALDYMKKSTAAKVAEYQLAKASTSVGANYEEAQGAYSKDEFMHKISICLKEARESHYWLRVIKSAALCMAEDLDNLIQEASELKNIFGSMVKKHKRKKD